VPALHQVVFTIKSSAYGKLMALDRCALDYGAVLLRVRHILVQRFQEFSDAPARAPSENKIRQMRLRIESVAAAGAKFFVSGHMCDLSMLPLGLAPRGLNIEVSVEKES
jgi:hypothetical protein